MFDGFPGFDDPRPGARFPVDNVFPTLDVFPVLGTFPGLGKLPMLDAFLVLDRFSGFPAFDEPWAGTPDEPPMWSEFAVLCPACGELPAYGELPGPEDRPEAGDGYGVDGTRFPGVGGLWGGTLLGGVDFSEVEDRP